MRFEFSSGYIQGNLKSQDVTPFSSVLLALAVYGGIFLALHLAFPPASLEEWHWRYVAMTGPRLVAFAWLGWMDRRRWQLCRFSWEGRSGAWPWLHGLAFLGIWSVLVSQGRGQAWGWSERLTGVLASFCVGLFEEYLFRGIVLESLRRRFAPQAACLWSALLFTVYHLKPGSIPSWGHIFLTGVVFAHWRLAGMSLGHLALIHGAVDASFFFAGREGPADQGVVYWAFLGGLYLYALVTAPKTGVTS